MSTEGFILLILGFCLAVVLTFLVPAYLGKKKRTNKKPNRRVSVSESASSDTANPAKQKIVRNWRNTTRRPHVKSGRGRKGIKQKHHCVPSKRCRPTPSWRRIPARRWYGSNYIWS